MLNKFENFVSLVNMSYKDLQKLKSAHIESLDLKGSHAICLFFLGNNEGGLTSGELCEKCREDKAAVSRNLKWLSDRGYVTLAEDGDKKYKLKNVLTEEGFKKFYQIQKLSMMYVENFCEGLTDKETAIFYKVLNVIVTNFDELCRKIEK